MTNKILFFGANYSLIFATKYIQSNVEVHIVCNDNEKKNYIIKYEFNNKKFLKIINLKKNKKIKFISKDSELGKDYLIAFLGMPAQAYDNSNTRIILKILIKKKYP